MENVMIIDNFKYRRKDLKITQTEFANIVGISTGTISLLERGLESGVSDYLKERINKTLLKLEESQKNKKGV